MPWARTEITATQSTRYLAGLPILASGNVTRLAQSAQWRESNVWSSGQDDTDPDNPVRWVYDGHHHLWTRPRRALAADRSLLFDFGASGVAFDVLAIVGHNANDIPGAGDAVAIEIADDTAFSTRLQQIAVFGPFSDARRLVSVTLGSGLDIGIVVGARYTAVRYLRVRFTSSSGTAWLPEMGELMLLTREALSHRQDVGYDEQLVRGDADRWVSETGRIVQVRRYHGQRIVRGSWTGLASEPADRIRSAWTSARGGKERLLWIENALTDVQGAAVVQPAAPSLVLNETDGSNRDTEIEMEEIPPFALREVA